MAQQRERERPARLGPTLLLKDLFTLTHSTFTDGMGKRFEIFPLTTSFEGIHKMDRSERESLESSENIVK